MSPQKYIMFLSLYAVAKYKFLDPDIGIGYTTIGEFNIFKLFNSILSFVEYEYNIQFLFFIKYHIPFSTYSGYTTPSLIMSAV